MFQWAKQAFIDKVILWSDFSKFFCFFEVIAWFLSCKFIPWPWNWRLAMEVEDGERLGQCWNTQNAQMRQSCATNRFLWFHFILFFLLFVYGHLQTWAKQRPIKLLHTKTRETYRENGKAWCYTPQGQPLNHNSLRRLWFCCQLQSCDGYHGDEVRLAVRLGGNAAAFLVLGLGVDGGYTGYTGSTYHTYPLRPISCCSVCCKGLSTYYVSRRRGGRE